jgi:hypothetical protein
MLAPTTAIKLLNVPLSADQTDQIDFASANNQYTYFNSRAVKTYETGFTYQRKDQAIDIPELIDNLWNVNYIMYKNPVFPNRWFYAFVIKQEFLNEHTTRLYLEGDIYQNWLFQMQFLPTFIEREHEDESE